MNWAEIDGIKVSDRHLSVLGWVSNPTLRRCPRHATEARQGSLSTAPGVIRPKDEAKLLKADKTPRDRFIIQFLIGTEAAPVR